MVRLLSHLFLRKNHKTKPMAIQIDPFELCQYLACFQIVKLCSKNLNRTLLESYTKACSINTLYFWPEPAHTAKKIAEILKPDGKLILAFEDIEQLKQRKLNQEVFHLYSKDEVQKLLINAGLSRNVSIVTRKKGKSIFHCVVAIK